MIDQNIPGFGDDNLGNDGDGDSLTKSKLNLNTSKDKKKPFFKKVSIFYLIIGSKFCLFRLQILLPMMLYLICVLWYLLVRL
jgi:hypothetical protein